MSDAKVAFVHARLSERPGLVMAMRENARGAFYTFAETAEVFGLVARAAELYGRRYGCESFKLAALAFLDDSERGSEAAALMRRAFALDETIWKANREYEDP